MCMRPFAWGGMLLVAVVAFVTLTGYRHARHQPPRMATILQDSHARESDVVRVSERGRRTVVTTLTPTRAKSRRGEDLKTVVKEWSAEGIDFTPPEAFESAIEKARALVTHDLGLSVPVSREFICERLKKDQHEEPLKDFVPGRQAYKVTLDLQLTRGTYLELAEADRAVRVSDRMDGMARLLSIVVIALGAVAGYVRLDEFTKGYYTGRLRLLTIAIVAAATFAIANV
jgi:hypothetical protein